MSAFTPEQRATISNMIADGVRGAVEEMNRQLATGVAAEIVKLGTPTPPSGSLVGRLTNAPWDARPICREAADEIERLQGELRAWATYRVGAERRGRVAGLREAARIISATHGSEKRLSVQTWGEAYEKLTDLADRIEREGGA